MERRILNKGSSGLGNMKHSDFEKDKSKKGSLEKDNYEQDVSGQRQF